MFDPDEPVFDQSGHQAREWPKKPRKPKRHPDINSFPEQTKKPSQEQLSLF
jgi:hypothetical protein